MRRQPWGLYAIALAILVVGLVALGVPASTLLVAALALTCPLMMIFMMSGMHGGADHTVERRGPAPEDHDHKRSVGRR
jgi:Protein of unknown function (DUF2933)